MDAMHIPAVAAFWGSATGSLATLVTSWLTRRREDRFRRTERAVSQREKLYREFIEEASRLYAEALVNEQAEPSQLVGMYALIGRMKIISHDDVVQAAEKVGRLILGTYLSPNRTLAELPDLIDEVDPLREFSDACRRELQTAGWH
jgi:hypothetical protein